MAGIDVKMGVSGIAQFKSAMQQGAQSVKTLDAALKKNEAQYKATGDAETYMQQKTQLLQKQIAAQQEVCSQAEKALEAMTRQGVDPASRAYQQMQQNLLNAQTALLGMQTDLNGVSTGAKGATDSARQMNTELKNIGKQVDYQAVINGIGKITDGMEKAATSVVKFAGNLWDTMRDAASWADDKLTLAQMYGISVEDLQKMEKTAEIIETPVEAIIKARQKLSTGLATGFSAEQTQWLETMGLIETGKYGARVKSYENAIDFLWDLGEGFKKLESPIDKDAAAMSLLGRNYLEYEAMFDAGRGEYDRVMGTWDVVAEENVEALGELDDALVALDSEFETVKYTALSTLAPAFTELAHGLTNVLGEINKYLNSDEGKEKMEALGNAITELFQDLTNVDTGAIVDKVSGALDTIKGVFEWIRENKDAIVTAIKAIGIAFVGLKAAEIAATLASAASGLKGLLLGSGGGTGNGGGSTTVIPTTSGGGGGGEGVNSSGWGSTLAKAADYFLLAGMGIEYNKAIGERWKYIKEHTYEAAYTWPNGQPFTAEDNLKVSTWAAAHGYDGNATMLDIMNAYLADESVQAENAAKAAEEAAKAAEEAAKTAELVRKNADAARLRHQLEPFITSQTVAHTMTEWDEQNAAAAESWAGEMMDSLMIAMKNYDPATQGATAYFNDLLYPIIQEYASAMGLSGNAVDELADQFWDEFTAGLQNENGENPELPVDPVLSDDAQGIIQQQLDGVTVHVSVIPDLVGTGVFADDGEEDVGFANGLPWVPHDGFYKLHGGERVMTAAQNRSYTSNSNIYFDHVNVGGGVDADGLAARIAERTRRAMSGFGG